MHSIEGTTCSLKHTEAPSGGEKSRINIDGWKILYIKATVTEKSFKKFLATLYVVIDGMPISTFSFKGNLSENHLSYMNKWYLIF